MKHFSCTDKKMRSPHHILTIKNKSLNSTGEEPLSDNDFRIDEEILTNYLIQTFEE